MKEFVLYISYRACTGYEDFSNNRAWVLNRAKNLIATNLCLHIIQILLLVANRSYFPIKEIDGTSLLIFIVVLFGLFFKCDFLFSKKLLANAIRLYKNHPINEFAKLTAFGYLFLNFVVLGVILYLRST